MFDFLGSLPLAGTAPPGTMKNSMKVSIIVPVFNAEKYLRECIESVIAQTLGDYELILVNDGSTDNSCRHMR